MSPEERQRILDALRMGCGAVPKSLVNVKASDILAMIEWLDELQGTPKADKPK